MARSEITPDSVKPEIKRDLTDADVGNRKPEIISVGNVLPSADYQAELAMGEEWIQIRLEESMDPEAAKFVFCSCNGEQAEIRSEEHGPTIRMKHVPVGLDLWIKRKYVEVLASAKIENIQTRGMRVGDDARNVFQRRTSQYQTMSILHDPNPRGRERMRDIMRRAI